MNIRQVGKLSGWWGVAGGSVLAALMLAGCKSGEAQFTDVPGAPVSPRATAALTAAGTATNALASDETKVMDTIRVADNIIVVFTDLPIIQQPMQCRVKEDGTITLLQNQTFTVAGKTRRQLEKEIRKRYVPDFFPNMTVNVEIVSQTQFYYVGGEVKAPGQHVYLSRTTVLQAIQAAGDFTDFANRKKIRLTRANGQSFTINWKEARYKPPLDLPVLPNDRIDVPRRYNPFW